MNLTNFIKEYDLNDCFLVGYYGGKNFGDDLLLELLLEKINSKKVQNCSVLYGAPENFGMYHRSRDVTIINQRKPASVLGALLRCKTLVVGGGGIWGLDFNKRLLVFSIGIWLCRKILRKKVYLVGVGYYSSTTRLGHIGAWFTAKGADLILARDQESFQLFKKRSSKVFLDQDIAMTLLPTVDCSEYKSELDVLCERLKISKNDKVIFISVRRFQEKYGNPHFRLIKELLNANRDKKFFLAILESKKLDPEGFSNIAHLQAINPNLQITDFSFNPVALYCFLNKYRRQLAVISLQYHLTLLSLLIGIPTLPISYDNKTDQLIRAFGVKRFPNVSTLTKGDLELFLKDIPDRAA